jgi:hypothetical protein
VLGGVAVALITVGVVLGVVLTRGPSKPPAPALTAPISWKDVPGLQTGKPPWPANAALLTARISLVGLAPLGQEQTIFHIHEHLDLFVDGKKVTVPQYVGIQINASGQSAVFAELHTHRQDGVAHVESARHVSFKLAQFFGVWGVRLTSKCLGSFKGSCDNLHAWVNGKRIANPANLILKEHQEIVISIGKPPAQIPTSYAFPSGE